MCCVCVCVRVLKLCSVFGHFGVIIRRLQLALRPFRHVRVLQPYRTVRYAPSGFVKRRSAELLCLSRISAPRLRQRLALPDFYSKDLHGQLLYLLKPGGIGRLCLYTCRARGNDCRA